MKDRRSEIRPGRIDDGLVQDVVHFATASAPDVPIGMPWRKVSRLYAYWDGEDRVFGRNGRPLPCAVDLTKARTPFRFEQPKRKHSRTEGVLNDLWRHGLRAGAHVDMQDARRIGTRETGAPESPVVTYCRRAGAAALVLWPLPGYQTPGTANYPAGATADTLPFSEKLDSVAWRGNLTGRAQPELGSAGHRNEHARDLVRRLGGADDDTVLAALDTVPRFRVLSRWFDRPDADVGLVLGGKWATGVPRAIARLERPRLDYPTLYRHRYLLSLSGNDGASNFLKIADSNSVVLREEDGWEFFYDGLFHAWEHYIPVSRGGDDLDERLDWARAHPRECEAISRRAQSTVRRLVEPSSRRAYLNGIREVYETRFKPR